MIAIALSEKASNTARRGSQDMYPPPTFSIQVENNSGLTIYVTACTLAGRALAEMHFQKREEDAWTDIPWNGVHCGAAGMAMPVAAAKSWKIPTIIEVPPTVAGEYRAFVPFSSQGAAPSVVMSDPFIVTRRLEISRVVVGSSDDFH